MTGGHSRAYGTGRGIRHLLRGPWGRWRGGCPGRWSGSGGAEGERGDGAPRAAAGGVLEPLQPGLCGGGPGGCPEPARGTHGDSGGGGRGAAGAAGGGAGAP